MTTKRTVTVEASYNVDTVKDGIYLRSSGAVYRTSYTDMTLMQRIKAAVRMALGINYITYSKVTIFVPLEEARVLSDEFIDEIYYDKRGEYEGEQFTYAE